MLQYASDMGGVLWNGNCSMKSKAASSSTGGEIESEEGLTTTSAPLLNGCPWEI